MVVMTLVLIFTGVTIILGEVLSFLMVLVTDRLILVVVVLLMVVVMTLLVVALVWI